MALKFGSLFTGIGGIDIGFERAGMVPVWQAEKDLSCRNLLAAHWPGVKVYDDVQAVTSEAERPDVIHGGFPCQDLSVAGKRAGLAGKRSGLFFEFVRVLGALAPRWVLIENVPGLLSSNSGRDMGTVLGNLGKLGYGFAYRVLDAQYIGVPQRRRRVFIVGCLGDAARAAKVLFEPESCDGDPPPGREAGSRVAATLRGRSKSVGVNEPGRGGEDDQSLVDVAYQANGAGSFREGDLSSSSYSDDNGSNQVVVTHALSSVGCDASEDGTGRGTPIVAVRAFTELGEGHQTYQQDDKAAAVRSGSGGGAGTATLIARRSVRRLTPRECERLQGLPDDFTAACGDKDTARYRMIGNAVCVPVAEWIGRRIVRFSWIVRFS